MRKHESLAVISSGQVRHMTIKYNILVFIGRLLFVTFIATILTVLTVLIFKGEKFKDVFLLIFFVIMFPIFIVSFVKSIFIETYDLIFDEGKLILRRPLIGTEKIIDIGTIKGFSTSEIKFGARWRSNLFKSKSVILYTDKFGPVELARYNYWTFDKIENKVRELGLTYLGHEDYRTGMFSRKYSF
jgi:hypothetical protein